MTQILLVTSVAQARELLAQALSEAEIGLDSEGTGLDYPLAQMAGFSMYLPTPDLAFYVPTAHVQADGTPQPYNVEWSEIKDDFQRVIDTCTIRVHSGAAEMLPLVRAGIRFRENRDSYLLANVMQSQTLSLKTLSLEFGVARYDEIITYKRLLAEVQGLTEEQLAKLGEEENAQDVYSFARVDVSAHERALRYACDDPRFTYRLWDVLFDQYAETIGDRERALELHVYQCDCDALLCESSARGYLIDGAQLANFVTGFSADVASAETELRNEIRAAMGWTVPVPPVPEPTVPAMPSLLDLL